MTSRQAPDSRECSVEAVRGSGPHFGSGPGGECAPITLRATVHDVLMRQGRVCGPDGDRRSSGSGTAAMCRTTEPMVRRTPGGESESLSGRLSADPDVPPVLCRSYLTVVRVERGGHQHTERLAA